MNKKTKSLILIAVLVSLFLIFLNQVGYLSNLNIKLTDNLYGGKPALNNIVIVGIDDKSLQELGRWPWNRTNFAEIINVLDSAKVIGIDVGFFEESNAKTDEELHNAAVKSENIVLVVEYSDFETKNDLVYGKEVLLPAGSMRDHDYLGYANIILDKDGVSRAININIQGEYPSFSEEVYKLYANRDYQPKTDRFLINFVGQPGSFESYSFSDVINRRIDSSTFSNKIVLIGATSLDLRDHLLVPTSKSKMMAGVEIHANALQTMILENELVNSSRVSQGIVVFIAAIITIIFFVILN